MYKKYLSYPFLKEILAKMLEFDEKKRPDFQQLDEILKNKIFSLNEIISLKLDYEEIFYYDVNQSQ